MENELILSAASSDLPPANLLVAIPLVDLREGGEFRKEECSPRVP